jgi:ABC-type nitrate/sulfonate/bicarbonate transport system ATPase subunit
MRDMYSDDTPMAGLQAIFEGAKSFGLSEEDFWRTVDDSLHEVGMDATVSEYLDELTGAMARRILATARQTASKEQRTEPEEPPVASEQEIL